MTVTFPETSWPKFGYDKEQVDAFFSDARRYYDTPGRSEMAGADVSAATFALRRGGYSTAEVDAALDRLEAAFIAKERAEFIATYGAQAWMAQLAERAQTLYPRLVRPAGNRFTRARRGMPAYDIDEVDALCQRLIDYFDQTSPITAHEVRTAVFTTRKGPKGYAEASVDAFLARAVEVLLGVE